MKKIIKKTEKNLLDETAFINTFISLYFFHTRRNRKKFFWKTPQVDATILLVEWIDWWRHWLWSMISVGSHRRSAGGFTGPTQFLCLFFFFFAPIYEFGVSKTNPPPSRRPLIVSDSNVVDNKENEPTEMRGMCFKNSDLIYASDQRVLFSCKI